MPNRSSLSDTAAREAAETTYDRNVVVVAGAGTGKTTLLVNRLVHLLMKEPDPVGLLQVVALTYTNKAATEMKIRLRERLAMLAQVPTAGETGLDGGTTVIEDLRLRYGVRVEDIADRATTALRDLEKAQIGTVHSFAGHLLRLYPLESGVDPAFREDDGTRFNEHFRVAWDVWVDRELSRQGTQHKLWRALLESTTVAQLRTLTFCLCSDLIDIEALTRQLEMESPSDLAQWIGRMATRSQALLDVYDRPKRRKVEHMLAAAATLMKLIRDEGPDVTIQLDATDRAWLEKKTSDEVSGWEEHDFTEATKLIKLAQQLLLLDHHYFNKFLKLVSPFITSVLATFADAGWLSFDGLLARARTLLWEHPAIRERVKREYRAVLIDEFQDTDPLQYEIILAVSEEPGHHSVNWQRILLEPGKLFIVGDPKQSIYAFRRADMEAFDRVVQKIEADGGIVHNLTTNFRSDASVLEPVNDIFDRLFVRRPLVQPGNVRLEGGERRRRSRLDPGVLLQITASRPGDPPFDAAGATRAEAEALACWLREEVLENRQVAAGQIALLFRTLTQADAYLDALRRYDIPYLIEGEKHFYRRQEVIDLVNVLRVLDHPHDHIALVGVLRSPLGGLTDRDIYDLHEAGLFHYLNEAGTSQWSHPRADNVRRLYRRLTLLHQQVRTLPLPEAIQTIFDELPVLELAAASLHGEQAVANLLKVKQTATALLDRPYLTFSGFIDLMVTRLDEQPEEPESPLAEESSDAVQILTIHKAKGLEFSVVVLPGLHQGKGREGTSPSVVYDWSTGSYGLSLGRLHTMGYLRVQQKLVERQEAERKRVCYVGMTRSKDLLLLSGAVASRSAGDTVLDWLHDIGEGEIGNPMTGAWKVGSSAIPHRVVYAPERKSGRRPLSTHETVPPLHPATLAQLWDERTTRRGTVQGISWRLTPTSLNAIMPTHRAESGRTTADRDVGQLAGVLAHRILEGWDFSRSPMELLDQIAPALDTELTPERDRLRPAVGASLKAIFTAFGWSDAYMRLRSATILGREVPFIMPWGDRQVMEGVIDLIYRLDGQLWIADYKTDQTTAEEAPTKAAFYSYQADIYRRAATKCLGLPHVSFHLLFLRAGTSMEFT
jgi:ATP-dependent helicase/nuclease subunit A